MYVNLKPSQTGRSVSVKVYKENALNGYRWKEINMLGELGNSYDNLSEKDKVEYVKLFNAFGGSNISNRNRGQIDTALKAETEALIRGSFNPYIDPDKGYCQIVNNQLPICADSKEQLWINYIANAINYPQFQPLTPLRALSNDIGYFIDKPALIDRFMTQVVGPAILIAAGAAAATAPAATASVAAPAATSIAPTAIVAPTAAVVTPTAAVAVPTVAVTAPTGFSFTALAEKLGTTVASNMLKNTLASKLGTNGASALVDQMKNYGSANIGDVLINATGSYLTTEQKNTLNDQLKNAAKLNINTPLNFPSGNQNVNLPIAESTPTWVIPAAIGGALLLLMSTL